MCVFIICLSLVAGMSSGGHAEWSGASTTCPSSGGLGGTCPTYQAACDSWAAFYKAPPELIRIIPFSTGYTCEVKHWFGSGNALVPTYPACGPGEKVNVKLPSGCQKHEGSECPTCKKGNPSVGNPIAVSNGNKFDQVTDFETTGPDALRFVRSYNSYETHEQSLGLGWRSNFDRLLTFPSSTITQVVRADGQEIDFVLTNGIWTPNSDIALTLTADSSSWTLTDVNDTVETYDNTGTLLTIQARSGYQQTLQYDTTPLLTTVSDTHGRTLTFTYDGPRLATMTDPDGQVFTYRYDTTNPYFEQANLLHQVAYPDETPGDLTDNPTVTYLYEDESYPYGLTGMMDENGDRYATYAYDDEGRATLSEHANGAEQVTIVYDSDVQRTVTDSLGRTTVYHFAWIQGVRKILQEDRVATATVPAATKLWTYDSNGYLASHTDWKGTLTTFVHTAQGLQTSRTEASGTPQARTITTTWHATFRVPTQIVEPRKTTDLTYDTSGNLLTRTETDTTGGSTNGHTRTWTYTYTTSGLLETVNGPRTDVTDTTTNTYTTDGYLKQVTNALGHVTEITSHNARGLPLTIKDANTVETQLSYDPRGRLTQATMNSSQGDATTKFAYDLLGQVMRITRPDGSVLNYEYDAAHRVTAITNHANERIDYTLDAEGNRTTETVKSSSGTIVRTHTRTFDSLSRLLTQVGASTQTTTYAYDANGNTISITDPLINQTQQAFDALNRLVKVTDPLSGEADYTYTAQDQLASVADQRSLTTTYTYNGFGEVIQLTSPDTGTTTYVIDAAGNRTQQTDARSIVTNYTYDALNRVTSRSYPASTSENVTYGYDDQTSGNNGKGRLTSLTDQSGTTSYVYGDRGNVRSDTRVIGGQTYVTQYQYDLADHLMQVTYPTGRLVTYQRDAQGRVAAVTTQTTASHAPTPLATNITYEPFGPITSLTYGNGLGLDLSYDQDSRLTAIHTANGGTVIQDLDYTYDAANNITAITDTLTSARTQTFGYDLVHRLTSATGLYGTMGYTYDAVGNRVTRTQGGSTETLAYAAGSNQLLSVADGTTTRTFSHTPNGQTTTDHRGVGEVYDLLYNHQNRLHEVKKNSLADTQYTYNALGQRVLKDTVAPTAVDLHFLYDQDGHLLTESTSTGAITREYIHLDGLPLAVVDVGSGGSTPNLDLILDNTDTGVTTSGNWTSASAIAGFEGTDYVAHAANGLPPGGQTLDNGATGFLSSGDWTTTTSPTGYLGTDYLRRLAIGSLPSTLTLDNTDSTVQTLGQWTAATDASGGGFIGSNYFWHPPGALPPEAHILDNHETSFSATGVWTLAPNPPTGLAEGPDYLWIAPNSAPPLPQGAVVVDNDAPEASHDGSWTLAATPWLVNYHGANYAWHAAGTGTHPFTWTPAVPSSGQYDVYAMWKAQGHHATNATYTIHHAGGSTPVVVNQTQQGGQWNLLGTVTLDPTSNHRVVLSDAANNYVIADAIAIAPAGATPSLPTATWQPTIEEADTYDVYAKWIAAAHHATDATYTVHHATGSTTVVANQTQQGGQWVLLGAFTLEPNEDHRIELSGVANNYVIADAVAVVPQSATESSNTIIWTPALTEGATFEISARWKTAAHHATDATYTIHHASGSTAVVVNHTQLGGQWNVLGTFTLDANQNHRIELSGDANNFVIADAIRLVPVAIPPQTATWSPTIASTGNYEVYARWPAGPAHTTAATYTVHHTGGSTPVVVNQTQQGGQWHQLGTFAMAPSANHRIELEGTSTGTVAADAVYVVPAGTSPNTVTWTPTLSATESVDIYAKWTSDADRADTVTYTVHHAGGSSPIVVNQRHNGGTWQWLGQFSLAPSSNHFVEVADSPSGVVVADAIRFVSAGGGSASGLMYVHTDHVGTPQKMTDGTRIVVWDAVYKPFGESHSITGTASNNQRFPGQYADAESGFSYNYFRDYDPTVGRYVESDPIGLRGGHNTFGYAFQNPLTYIDPRGTEVTIVCRPVGSSGGLAKHCAVIVWHWEEKECGGTKEKVIDHQYSISFGHNTPGERTNDFTEITDREAFENPGGTNEHYDIPPPSGTTQQDFDSGVIQKGENYSAEYWLYPGPNSNTAAVSIVEGAGGIVPNIPGAYGQNYED